VTSTTKHTWVVAGTGIVVSALGYVIGIGFDLNGDQYSWWATVWSSFAFFCAITTAVAAWRTHRGMRVRIQAREIFGIATGVAVTIGAMVATIWLYPDSYRGSFFWPHVLACIGAAGLAIAFGSAVLAMGRDTTA
jgi:hypothetical protein